MNLHSWNILDPGGTCWGRRGWRMTSNQAVVRLQARNYFQFLRQLSVQDKAAPADPRMTHLDVNLSKTL